MKMQTWTEFKKELMQDPEFRREYEKLEIPFQIACKIIDLRIKHDYTQAQLAAKIGTKQSAIARLESGYQNLSVSMLEKIAAATDSELQITFRPIAKAR